jgi:hypothetical protein
MKSKERELSGGRKTSLYQFYFVSVVISLIVILTPALASMFVVWLAKPATFDVCHKLQLTPQTVVFAMIIEFVAITAILCFVECAILKLTPLGAFIKNKLTRIKDKA